MILSVFLSILIIHRKLIKACYNATVVYNDVLYKGFCINMNQQIAKLDTLYKIETPEGINLVFRPASPIIRSIALLLDVIFQLIIFGIFLGIIFFSITLLDFDGMTSLNYAGGLFLIFTFIMMWWYFVLLEVLNKGQSIGKRFCNIRVIHDDGTPVGWTASLLRNLLRAVDLLPSFSYAVGLIVGLNNKEFKRLGDLAAGTLVVYNEVYLKPQPLPDIIATPCPFPLTQEQQQIIIAYAERRQNLSVERRHELANILSDHFGLKDEQLEHKLYQIAQYLIGTQDSSNLGRES